MMPGGQRTGPGCLVLVVGPSGAGKDALIRGARERLAGDPAYLFPRRIVTRPPSDAEDNDMADEAGFARMAAAGEFAVAWAAHGLRYALPRAIDASLAQGRCVVCNVSRTVVDALRQAYDDVVVIEVTAPPEILARRLSARDRLQDGDPARRLARSDGIGAIRPDVTIVNAGALDAAVTAFLAALRADHAATS